MNRKSELEQLTGTLLSFSNRGEFYPGTGLRELNIQGPSLEAVVQAMTLGVQKIQEENGQVLSGEPQNVEQGGCRLKVLVPRLASAGAYFLMFAPRVRVGACVRTTRFLLPQRLVGLGC